MFVPKVRKQRGSVLNRKPPELGEEGKPVYRSKSEHRGKIDAARDSTAKKPVPRKNANRRIRQSSDLAPAPDKQKACLQKKER